MSKSRIITVFVSFCICILLFSCQWKPSASPAVLTTPEGNAAQTRQENAIVPSQLYEQVNGKTPDEVSSLLSSLSFTFNRDLYPGNELMQADLYRQDLQKDQEQVYLLQLSQSGMNWHYIILMGNAQACAYKGSIILPGNPAHANDFRVVEDPVSHTVWVVLKELVGSGTGIAQYNEVWYRISDKAVVKDLQYIINMHQWMSLSQLVFYTVDGTAATQSHVNETNAEPSEFYVDVLYHLEFFDSSALNLTNELDAFLFDADRRIRYVWKADEKRFRIDSEQSGADTSLFDFSKQALMNNFKAELEKLQKSELKVKQDWLEKLEEQGFVDLKGPEVTENLNAIEIMNLNDEQNASVVLSLPEGFTVRKLAFPKAPNFEYQAEKNKTIDTVYSFEIYNLGAQDKFRFYGTEGLAGWFYDTSYYREKPEALRFTNHSAVKAKIFEGDTVLGKGEIFVLNCDILQEELKTEAFSTYELVYAWIPIEDEELAYNLTISVPLGEDSEPYAEMVKTMLLIQ